MKKSTLLIVLCVAVSSSAQDPGAWLNSTPQAKDYVQHRASSYDRSGANADFRTIAPGDTLTLVDKSGPGLISHIWVTIATNDPDHLKEMVLRMYWDAESSRRVEWHIGVCFCLG